MKSQKGFAHLEIVLLVVLVGIIGVMGAYIINLNKKQSAKSVSSDQPKVAKQTDAINVKPQTDTAKVDELNSKDIVKLKATAPAKTPSTSVSPSSNPSTPNTTPAKPSESGTVTISSDGCTITAVGTVGLKFEVGAFSNSKGGLVEFTIPASGSLTTSSGGFQNMTSYGKLTNAGGTQIAYNSGTITATSCPAAG